MKKLQKGPYLVDFGPICGPPGARLGLPGSSKMAYNSWSTHRQNSTSLWDMAELTLNCKYEKTAKKPKFGGFWPYFWTLPWLVRPSLFIAISPNPRARALTNLLFKQRPYGAYRRLQILFFPWKSPFLSIMALENAYSSVKTNTKTSIWTQLPLYVSRLGHWPKIRPLMRIWLIIFLRFFHFFPKIAILGLFFHFLGPKIYFNQNMEPGPPDHFFTAQVPKKRIFILKF